ncbi:MAG: hypothetical protein ABSG13_14620 [Bryobacteraceae bacterium]|jgi:hypothetical protein
MFYRLIPFVIVAAAFAQQAPAQQSQQLTPAQVRLGERAPLAQAPLFFREEWKTVPGAGEHGVTQESVWNPRLELKLYGASSKEIQETGKLGDPNNPPHVWSGLCTSPCAVALRDKNDLVDLTGLAKIRWVTKVSGFHQVHPIVKLADGTWLVGDHADGSTVDWLQNEFSISEVRWMKLDIDKVVTKGNWVEHPDLSKVDEVGFTDLLPGSGHGPGGWSDVAAFEVYGKAVKRDGGATTSSR